MSGAMTWRIVSFARFTLAISMAVVNALAGCPRQIGCEKDVAHFGHRSSFQWGRHNLPARWVPTSGKSPTQARTATTHTILLRPLDGLSIASRFVTGLDRLCDVLGDIAGLISFDPCFEPMEIGGQWLIPKHASDPSREVMTSQVPLDLSIR
jgi:hypothetical protein